MGCDIHIFTEAKRTILDNEKWVNIDNWRLNPYFGSENEEDLDEDDWREPEYTVHEIYRGRSYHLFARLADVRNYYACEYIDRPRGIPSDASDIVKKEAESWGRDGHSHSYCTLKELKEFQAKHNTIKIKGLIGKKQKEDLDNGIKPQSWCQWSNSDEYVEAEWEDDDHCLDNLIECLENRMDDTFLLFGNEERHPKFEDKIRVVFWFDN